MTVKIVVSGPFSSEWSGVVALLVQAGHQLLLVAGDETKMGAQFLGLSVSPPGTWELDAQGYDTFLHLAVMNNDQEGSLDDLIQANAAVTSRYAEGANRVGISRFIYPLTVRALLPGNESAYGKSKVAEIEAAKLNFSGAVDVVYLGLVHGQRHSGKLSFLNKFPQPIRSIFFSFFSILKPTTSVELVADYVGHSRSPGGDHPFILTDQKTKTLPYGLWRKSLGVAFVVGVLLLVPFLVIVWILVVIEDGRPGFFTQERIGVSNSVFRCVKFRTMRNGTESKGSHLVPSNAVTRLGSVLRRLKIDELPQAWNVARGEMVLIGPRPCLPHQEEVIAARESFDVVDYRPGLTGWAQVNGVDMSEPDKIAGYDAEYLGLQSVWLDVLIMKKTVFAMRGTNY